jgi:hypothetical protein
MKQLVSHGLTVLITFVLTLLGFNAYLLYQKHGLINEVLGLIGIMSSIVLITLVLLPSVKFPPKDSDSTSISQIRNKYEKKVNK